jgi:hypothetical protein
LKNEEFLLTENDFLFFNIIILSMNFSKKSRNDLWTVFTRLGLSPPPHRKIIGSETTYEYINPSHGYKVVVHTTYLEKEKKWRDKSTDIGWVLIVEGDKAIYFAKPFQRKKGFLMRMLRYAWITKWKVDHRPLCPKCQGYMNLARKKTLRQYFWACSKNSFHIDNKPQFLPWDYSLPPKASEFVKIRRAYTARYRAKIKKLGKEVTRASKIRKKWIINNSHNLR